MVDADLNRLLNNPNDLMRYLKTYLTNNRVVWSTYDRQKIEKTMKENSYVFSAIQKIARAFSSINFMVGRYDKEGNFIEDVNNNLYRLLKKPNAIQDWQEFGEAFVNWYYGFGEAFIYSYRYSEGNNKGQIMNSGLMFAPPQIVDIKADGIVPTGYVINGNISQVIPTDSMIHIKSFNPDWEDLHGLPFIAVAGRLIDKLDAADETEIKNFQNGGPAFVMSPKNPDGLTQVEYNGFADRLKSLWKNPKNKGGIVATPSVIDIQSVGKSPVDLGTLESSKNTLKMLCTVWQLDPGLFLTEASTYNNKQEITKAIYTEAAIPLANRLASKLTSNLGELYGGVQVVVDTSNIEVLQPNNKTRVEWMVLANAFSENEIREGLGYEAVEGEASELTPAQKLDIEAIEGFKPDDLDKEVIE